MARIAGVDLPKAKRMEIALTYIYGIGRSSARKVLTEAGVNFDVKTDNLAEEDLVKLRRVIDTYKVEGDTSSATSTSAPTAASATGRTCRCGASAHTPTRGPARVRVKPSPARSRRRPSKASRSIWPDQT
jgi:ribosomal protein S13